MHEQIWGREIIQFHMYTIMAVFWWTGCQYGGFKVLQWCSCFPHAFVFDVQHVAGNSLRATGALILTVSSTVYVYTCEPVHVCVCVHACMCAIRCVLRALKCLPLSVIPLSAATCSAHTPNPDRSKHRTPSNPVKSLFTDDLVWRQQAAGVGDRKGGKERRREGRRGEGWERLRWWSYQGVAHCRGLLLWAIVKELGGIIGLLCPMWSMHF